MQRSPKEELTRQWLVAASEDVGLAGLAAQARPPYISGALYHCQQAFEKALKGFLTWHGQPVYRTHNLPGLLTLCEQFDSTFIALAADAALLTPYATQFRYPPIPVTATEAEAVDALSAARNALGFVLKQLPPATHP
jgi:HEPN domain-containing protein